MSELFLEILSEEMPAGLQEWACLEISAAIVKKSEENFLNFTKILHFFSPRRLSFCFSGIPQTLADVAIEKKGPKIDAPEQVINAFLISNDAKLKDLEVREVKDKKYYFLTKSEKAPKISELLASIICEVLSEFTWPKSMRWGTSEMRWVRPIQNILCILDGKILPFSFGEFKANNISFGHKFMKNEPFGVESFEHYCEMMKKSSVMFDHVARKESIRGQIAQICAEKDLLFKIDEELLDEVTGLVEFPNVLVGKIDEKFMNLPKEVLVNSLKDHQRYFILENFDGTLSNFFMIVANVVTKNDQKIIEGNEKVLRSRLSDAQFFINQDSKSTLFAKIEKLKKVSFHEKLGSVHEKTLRIEKLAVQICQILLHNGRVINENIVKRASILCKADLTTEIVSEFPKLQGIMGSHYAKFDGENDDVAQCIQEHYQPISADATILPNSLAGAVISIADRMDSLVGMFISGNEPTSSKDPFALRRGAISIIRILLHHEISLNLAELIEKSIQSYENAAKTPAGIERKILEFFAERFKFFFKKEFTNHNLINAVSCDQNPFLSHLKLLALRNFTEKAEFPDFISSYRRANNLIAKEKIQGEVNEKLFKEQAEKDLHSHLLQNSKPLEKAMNDQNFPEIFRILLSFKEPLAKFFEDVMVMDENEEISLNRKILLTKIKSEFEIIANFSLIEVN